MHSILNKFRHLFRPSSFITTVMVLSTLPLVFVMYLTYSISEKSLLESVEKNLRLIVRNKASTIDNLVLQTV